MNTTAVHNSSPASKWAGRTFTALVMFATCGSALAKIAGIPTVVDGLMHAGFPRAAILPIALLEISCTILFLIPRTAGLGSLLLTGFFGGAIVTHIVGGESFAAPAIVGLFVWAAAYFRVPEFSALLPLRTGPDRREVYQGAGHRRPVPTRG